jgi:hypothetical protein
MFPPDTSNYYLAAEHNIHGNDVRAQCVCVKGQIHHTDAPIKYQCLPLSRRQQPQQSSRHDGTARGIRTEHSNRSGAVLASR